MSNEITITDAVPSDKDAIAAYRKFEFVRYLFLLFSPKNS